MTSTKFVAVDWGTTSFRLWVIGADASIVASDQEQLGMNTLQQSDYSTVLEECLTKLGVGGNIPVVICGMAGAAQGWCEAPYLSAPTPINNLGSDAIKVSGIERNVWILPGVKQMSPPSVMRGEETQIAGLLQKDKSFEGVVCLPGTHTKWVSVKQGEIKQFATCMTGEIFSLLSSTSILRHSMMEDGWNEEAFVTTVQMAIENAHENAMQLFELRAETLLGDLSSATARARLSGLLIGHELSAARGYWQRARIRLIGAPKLAEKYAIALETQGVSARIENTEKMTLAGLQGAFHRIGVLA
ncbi:MAG: 2-dehydro-3-deoxygalactonokinase [Rhizobiaceae bacterium]